MYFKIQCTLRYAILGASYGTYLQNIFPNIETASIHGKIFFPEIDSVYKSIDLYINLINSNNGIPLYDNNNTRHNITYDIFNLDWTNPNQIINTAIYISNNYNFVLSILTPQYLSYIFPLYCNNKCLVVNAFPSYKSDYICDNSLQDCVDNNIKNKFRRFHNLFTSFRDFSLLCNYQIVMWKNLDIKTLAIVYPDDSTDMEIYNEIINTANDLHIDVKYSKIISVSILMEIISDINAIEIINNLINNNIDGLLIIGTSTSLPKNYVYSIQKILDYMENINYIPKVVSIELGSLDLLNPSSIRYFWSTYIWDSRLSGYDFRAINSFENLEIYSSVDGKASPEVFLNTFLHAYPQYKFVESSHISSSLATISLIIFQKLIELSNSIKYNDLILASTVISTPSISGLIQFDRYGRFITINNDLVVSQISVDESNNMNYKFNLIHPITEKDTLVFPIPNWNERVYIQNARTTNLEKGFISFNAFLTFIILNLIYFTFKNRHNVIIKASSPNFLIIFLIGQLSMCIGNYFYNLDPSNTECNIFFWFVSIGFDLSFGSLFLKTLRIGQIFNIQKLQMLNLTDSKLIKYLFIFLTYTTIVNIVYSTKLESILIASDSNRPSYNYHICFYSVNDYPFLICTTICKALLVLFGIYSTFSIRNVQTVFNESRYLGISIYGSFICSLIFGIAVYTNSSSNYNLYIFINIWIFTFIINNIFCMYYKKVLDYVLEKTYVSKYIENSNLPDFNLRFKNSNKIKPLNIKTPSQLRLENLEKSILNSSFSPTDINSPFKSPSTDLHFHLQLFKKI